MECDTQDVLSSDLEQVKSKQQQAPHSDGPVEKKMRPASEFAEYDDLVDQLADCLQIARHPDSAITVRAAKLVIGHIISSKSSPGSAIGERQDSSNLGNPRQSVAGDSDNDRNPAAPPARIQRSKFTLDDVSLPKAQLKLQSHIAVERDDGGGNISSQNCQKQSSPAASGAGAKDELEIAFVRAAKALKLLYLNDQKQLQIQVNALISAIQAITADPKTDPRLISVGR